MYSAASPRLTIHSAIGGGFTPNAMFCAYVAQVAWLSPHMPQMRLVIKWASRGSLPFMKMLYPRKIEDVLWHSATLRLPKSIFVKMPRLPTILVIGSQFISTNLLVSAASSLCAAVIVPIVVSPFASLVGTAVTGIQFGRRMPPLGLFVHGVVRHLA